VRAVHVRRLPGQRQQPRQRGRMPTGMRVAESPIQEAVEPAADWSPVATKTRHFYAFTPRLKRRRFGDCRINEIRIAVIM